MSSAHRHNFAGLKVISFESRHAEEISRLIEYYKGVPTVVPVMREVPLQTTAEFQEFERVLMADELDMVIFLTGNGAHLLAHEIDKRVPRQQWIEALQKTAIVARGPKPVTALRELGLPVSLRVNAPHTWREVLSALDANKVTFPVQQRLVAVQEYGMMHRKLLKGLKSRGAEVLRVPVYKWALPENLRPLRFAIENITEGRFDVAIFTCGTQVWHLFKMASKKGMEDELRRSLRRMAVGSLGPTTSEALDEFAVQVDFTPPQAKMGHLVKYAAFHAQAVLDDKASHVATGCR